MKRLFIGVVVVFMFVACDSSHKEQDSEQVRIIQSTTSLSPQLLAKLDLGAKERRTFIMQDMHDSSKIALLEITKLDSYNNQSEAQEEEYQIALFTLAHTATLPIGFTIPVAKQDSDLLLARLSDGGVRLELNANGILELEYLDDAQKHSLFSQFYPSLEVDFISAQLQYFIAKRKCGGNRECFKFVASCEEFEECYSNRALVSLPFIPLTNDSRFDFVIRNINKEMYRFLEHSTAQQDLFYAQDLSAQRQQIRDYLKERLGIRRIAQKIFTFKIPHSDFLGTSKLSYIDSKLIVFVMNMYFYEGAEQYIYAYPMVFDLRNGEQLVSERVENLFYAGVRDYDEEVSHSLKFMALLEKYHSKQSLQQCLPKDEGVILPPDNFFIKHSGVAFTYNTKGLVPNGCGIIEVLVPFSELKPFVETSSPYAYLFGI